MGTTRTHILLLAAFAFLLLFIAGCTVKQNMSMGCCVLDKSDPHNPVCGSLKGDTSSGVEIAQTYFCIEENATCDVSVKITIPSPTGGSPTVEYRDETLPICSDRTSSCISENCQALVCGPYRYEPTPVPSLKDTTKFTSDTARAGGTPGSITALKGKTVAENLYNTQCIVLPTNDKLQNFLQNSKGSAIDLFRFGVGSSFQEFDRYRFMFPFSDSYCNSNPFIAGTKDRYLNYLLTPEEFQQKTASQDEFDLALAGQQNSLPFELPWQAIQSEAYCPSSSQSPFLGPLYSGADFAGYKFDRMVPLHSASRDAAGLAAAAPDANSASVELDTNFYANFLSMIYDKELSTGLQSVGDTPIPAPFECTSGMECASGNCNYQVYNRGLCQTDEGWVRCSCAGEARYCYGGSIFMNYSLFGKPATAADYEKYVNAYLQDGENFLVKEKGKVELNLAKFNPSCDLSEDGVEWTKDYAKNCVLSEDSTSADCTIDPMDLYGLNCTKAGGPSSNTKSYNCVPRGGDSTSHGGYSYSCTKDGDMECDVSGPFVAQDCDESQGFPSKIFCDQNRIPCDLKPSKDGDGNVILNSFDATCSLNNWVPKQSGLSLAGTYDNSTVPHTLSATLSGSQKFTDCTEDTSPDAPSGQLVCGKEEGNEQSGRVPSDPDKTLDAFRFPQDIQFFGSIYKVQNGANYVGYSLLTADDFALTDFAHACDLEGPSGGPGANGVASGRDYDVINAFKYTWGRDYVVNAWWGGTLIRPPSANPELSIPALWPLGGPFGLPQSPATDPYDPIGGLPLIMGAQQLDGGECHWYGDDTTHYAYVPKFIFIKISADSKIGKCYADETTGMPLTKSFGWCEACSYATLAKQAVTSVPYVTVPRSGYFNPANATYRDFNMQKNYSLTVADNPGSLWQAQGIPDSYYLGQREVKYLKEGVMPVFDLTDSSNWVPMGGSYVLNGVVIAGLNSGPAMLVVDSVDENYNLDEVSVKLTPNFNAQAGTYAVRADITTSEGTGSLDIVFGDAQGDEFGQFTYRSPVGASSITIGSMALDFGNSAFHDDMQQADMGISATRGGIAILATYASVSDYAVTVGGTVYGNGEDATKASLKAAMDRFSGRYDGARTACGKCMIGFRVTNGPGLSGSQRLMQNMLTVKVLNATGTYDTATFNEFNKTNFIDFQFYPSDYTEEDAGLCDPVTGKASSDLNSRLFTSMRALARSTLSGTQKVSLISDFSIGTSPGSNCWGQGMTQSFLSYLFAKQKLLSTSGLTGVIYSDASSFMSPALTTTDTFGDEAGYAADSSLRYCPVQKGSQWHVADTPITVYNKVYASQSAACEQCQDLDIVLGTCNKKCANNIDCIEPADMTGPFKCPQNTVVAPCKPCNQSSAVLSCKFFRSDGTTDSSTYSVKGLSDLSPDIISSIPQPSDDVCCLSDANGNYSYMKQTSTGQNVAPMIFSLSSDPNADCGIADLSSLDPNTCGSVIPIKNYRVECVPAGASGFMLWGGHWTEIIKNNFFHLGG